MDIDNIKVNIWQIGNTGLRNPERIKEGFELYACSPYVGELRGENEKAFTELLNSSGIIKNAEGKDVSGSHARKWRLMFSKHGFIYPKIKEDEQKELGPVDAITPFGMSFRKAQTLEEVHENFLRAQSVAQETMVDTGMLFSPLRWTLAIMLEIEKRTGSSAISRLEFALWVQTTDPRYDVNLVADRILDLRKRREAITTGKKKFDNEENKRRLATYDKKVENTFEYCDMNMRYLRITGIVQRHGKGLKIVPAKHVLAEKLASSDAVASPLLEQFKILCNGAPLPSDNLNDAIDIFNDLKHQISEQRIAFDSSSIDLTNILSIKSAIYKLEALLSEKNEEAYALSQRTQWQEIADYMQLLINGCGKMKRTQVEDDDDNEIEIPKDEASAYLEWTLWRAMLAIDNLKNSSSEVRGFNLDADFRPVSTAGGGRGDLYCDFSDYMLLTEVTLSTSSRQEAMEGEPVRRHVSDACEKYKKQVFGLFIANKINTNTAETFRHSVWYTADDKMTRLDILPLTLEQFCRFFKTMFKTEKVSPDRLKDLILLCKKNRDSLDAPAWKLDIASIVDEQVRMMEDQAG